MASVKYEVGSTSTIMTTVLTDLDTDTNAISSELDNTAGTYVFDDVELKIIEDYAGNFSDGSGIELYMVRTEVDGVGYEDGDATIDPPAANFVAVFQNNTDATQVHILRQIPISPAKYKYVVINKSGKIGTGTLKRRPYTYQDTT